MSYFVVLRCFVIVGKCFPCVSHALHSNYARLKLPEGRTVLWTSCQPPFQPQPSPLFDWRSAQHTGGAENARLENAELENAAPNCKTGKRETGKRGTKLQDWKTRDWKTRERIGYGKPIKPKQPVI